MEDTKGKKEDFIKRLSINKRKQILFFLGSMTILLIGYFTLLKKASITGLAPVIDHNIITNVYISKTSKECFELYGWALRIGSHNEGICVVLRDMNKKNYKILETTMETMDGVKQYFDSENDVGNCGFKASIREQEINKNTCYEIFVILTYQEPTEEGNQTYQKKVATGKYLYEGEVYGYNPREFRKPDISNAYAQEVIEKGEILSYDFDKGIWIYRYDNQFHWIVSFSLLGDLSEKPEIALLLYSSYGNGVSSTEQAPSAEYISRHLDESDYQQDSYFFYSIPISPEASIEYIETGVYHNLDNNPRWIWKDIIHINSMLPY